MLNKREEIFQNAIEGKLRVQDKSSERMHDQIIEEIKELVQEEEALQLAGEDVSDAVEGTFSQMKNDTPTNPQILDFFEYLANRVGGLSFVFSWFFSTVG